MCVCDGLVTGLYLKHVRHMFVCSADLELHTIVIAPYGEVLCLCPVYKQLLSEGGVFFLSSPSGIRDVVTVKTSH